MDFTRYEFVRITIFLCLNYKIIRAPQNIAAKNAKRTPHKIVSHAGLWSQCTSELAVQSAALAYSIQRESTVWAHTADGIYPQQSCRNISLDTVNKFSDHSSFTGMSALFCFLVCYTVESIKEAYRCERSRLNGV